MFWPSTGAPNWSCKAEICCRLLASLAGVGSTHSRWNKSILHWCILMLWSLSRDLLELKPVTFRNRPNFYQNLSRAEVIYFPVPLSPTSTWKAVCIRSASGHPKLGMPSFRAPRGNVHWEFDPNDIVVTQWRLIIHVGTKSFSGYSHNKRIPATFIHLNTTRNLFQRLLHADSLASNRWCSLHMLVCEVCRSPWTYDRKRLAKWGCKVSKKWGKPKGNAPFPVISAIANHYSCSRS